MPSMKMSALMVSFVTSACLAGSGVAAAAGAISCTVSANDIVFGVYNPLVTTGNSSTSTLSLICSGGSGSAGVTISVTLNPGVHGTYAARKMASGSNVLNYNIYWNTAHSQIAGDGTGGSSSGTVGAFGSPINGSGTATNTLYGLIPALQDVAPGGYTDVITITVSY